MIWFSTVSNTAEGIIRRMALTYSVIAKRAVSVEWPTLKPDQCKKLILVGICRTLSAGSSLKCFRKK